LTFAFALYFSLKWLTWWTALKPDWWTESGGSTGDRL